MAAVPSSLVSRRSVVRPVIIRGSFPSILPRTTIPSRHRDRFGIERRRLVLDATAKFDASVANGPIMTHDVDEACTPGACADAGCVSDSQAAPATLGDVLYARHSRTLASEREWVDLVGAVAAGNQMALHRLYERTHRLVFTLAKRISGNRESAEELTLDVFLEVWRRAGRYDPANGTVLGWIMNLARSRAIDRLRFEQRKKRVDPCHVEPLFEIASSDSQHILEEKQQAQALREALSVLSPDERRVIEAAFLLELTHAEVAAKFNEPLGTVKTRIRTGLLKLRRVLAAEARP
jgi:RNA polymerase sigma-70 factor, ECF subfamily